VPRLPRSLVIAAAFVVASAAAGAGPAWTSERISTLAVFPVENLSGRGIPADEIRLFLGERLVSQGVTVLSDEALDDFMRRHRVRYAAGIDAATAASLRQETGVEGVVIASVSLSSDGVPPKISLTVRLVSTGDVPVVAWADDVGLSGDDAPGLLDLGLVDDYPVLFARALDGLADSLLAYLTTRQAKARPRPASKFRPKVLYRNLALESGRTYSVAVLPFFNLSGRRNAGEILAGLFMRHLSAFDGFRVVDTGEVRQQLLEARVIMDGGISLSDAERVAAVLDVDFVLAGRVLAYQDYDGPEGQTRADFSTIVIERKSRRVVWSSHSYNDGQDGVRFFGRGRSATAHQMATQMVGLATATITKGQK
jgi:TolB-like protein